MRFERAEFPLLLNDHDATRRFFSFCFPPDENAPERLWVAHIDNVARCLLVECYQGEPESVVMPVREIILDAARLGSAGIVLAHNHPSGDSSPSKADCRATRKLATACEALDLAILDHLIFAGRDCSSMRKMGLL